MEQLYRLPVKGEGRDWEQGRTRSYFVEVRNGRGKPGMRNIFWLYSLRFVGELGEDTNRAWKTINDFQRCTEDSFDQDSRILFVFVSDYRGEKIAASLVSLKKSWSDFLLDILENPPGGDSFFLIWKTFCRLPAS